MKNFVIKKFLVGVVVLSVGVLNLGFFEIMKNCCVFCTKTFAECVEEDVLVDEKGEKFSDFLNYCYYDSDDGDALGNLSFTLFSYAKDSDFVKSESEKGKKYYSIFFDRDKVKVDFIDSNGECRLTKEAICEGLDKKKDSKIHGNVFKVNKKELEFGKKYTLKFYDELDEARKKLLASFVINIQESEKS